MLLTASIIAVSGCGAQKTVPEQSQETKSVLVETEKAVTGNISSIATVTGKIAAQMEVSIIPKMGGKVAEVNFEVGDRVHTGDVLVRLDSTEIQAQLKQARAALAMAKANYENALANLERTKSLFEQGAVSQQQLEAAQTMVATGSPDSAAAAVQLMEAQLANTIIKSPAEGIVASRSVEVGEMAGQMPVMTIVGIDKVKVQTNVTEGEVNKLKVGQKVTVIVSAVGEEPFTGTIATISPAADSLSSTFPISIEISNSEHKLKPGMFAEAKLVLETKEGVLVLPKQAVIDSGDKKYVYVVKDNKAIQTEITTGIEDDERVEIVSGLQAGDMIVLSGQNKLQNETPVTVSGGK
ncbi:MAG: efflux RND transporter periplasmic adaptor subunit [Bacillota bacterium]